MAVRYEFDKKRFEAFIDAIIAILLTILVLEIRIPEDQLDHESTYQQVRSLLPYFISYLASFMLIAGFWIDYHLLFVNINKITKGFVLINMLFILSISFAPFVTAFAGKHYHDSFAVALLSSTYFIMNFFFMLVFKYAKAKDLTDPIFWTDNKRTANYSTFGIAAILLAIPLSYVNTYIPFAIFLFIFGGHLIKKQ
ncbi:MAG: TMEM175 family protein [Saprospiraceae bacterium]